MHALLLGHLRDAAGRDPRYAEIAVAGPSMATKQASWRVPADTEAARRQVCVQCPGGHFGISDIGGQRCAEAKKPRCLHPQAQSRCLGGAGVLTEPASRHAACPIGAWEPTWPLRFDEHTFFPGYARPHRFNSSIVAWGDGYALAFRDGWRGSDIHLALLDANFRPLTVHKIPLSHRDANYGREDPRLFRFGDRLHLMFIGVVGGARIRHTNVLFARLTPDLRGVEDVFHPEIPGRNLWEKNHQYFQHGDALYAVYSVAPHKILRVAGNRAEWAFETPTPAPWSGGELRGGAAPVPVGDEFWCFFHGRAMHEGRTAYNVGLYTFAARPPFEVRRITPEPILWADHGTKPGDQYVSCVFPCGAVHRPQACGDGGDWIVSMGVHDRWTELHRWRHADLERRLAEVRPANWFHFRAGTNDASVWGGVVSHNEYRLPERFAADDVVIDIGGHVGSFAYAAHQRGSRNIHSYEAAAANYASLCRNAEEMPGVYVHHAAVWDADGETVFSHPPTGHAENLGASWVSDAPRDEAVPTIAFDSILRRFARVAFLKIDCERSEFRFLPGSQELHRVGRIALEFHATPDLPVSLLTEKLQAAGFAVEVRPAADNPLMGLIFGHRG